MICTCTCAHACILMHTDMCKRVQQKNTRLQNNAKKFIHLCECVLAFLCVCVCVFVGASQCLTVCACVHVCEPAIRRLQLPPAQKSTGTAKGDITWLQQTTTQSTYSQSTTNVPQIYCFEQKFAN